MGDKPPSIKIPSPSSPSLRSRNPLIAARGSGGALVPPAGPGGARPPDVYWCIFGIILHLFECYNDEEFPVICSLFEGRFHSIDIIIARCGHFL